MQLKGTIVKVTNLIKSRRWYSSLLFEDPSSRGEGWYSWRSGVTIVNEEKWNDLFGINGEDSNVSSISMVMEISSFDTFLRILSLRDDRDSIVIGEGLLGDRRSVRLIDPDMNIVVVVECEYDEATVSDDSISLNRKSDCFQPYSFKEKEK